MPAPLEDPEKVRRHIVSVKLNDSGLKALEELRGEKSKSTYFRDLLVRDYIEKRRHES